MRTVLTTLTIAVTELRDATRGGISSTQGGELSDCGFAKGLYREEKL